MLLYNDIHRSYYDRVVRFLRPIVGAQQAEDMAQDVFIKIFKNLDSLRDETRLSSWIYRIALNTARDGLRSMKAGVPTVALDGVTGPDRQPLIERIADTRTREHDEAIAKKEMAGCFIDFVEKLPPQYYDVYVLSEFEGLTDAEIADRLSLTLQTVKIRLHRARTRLYEELRSNCSCYCSGSGDLMCEPRE